MNPKRIKILINAIVTILALLFVVEKMYVAFALTVVIGITMSSLIRRAAYSKYWEPDFDERDLAIEAVAARMLIKLLFLGGGLTIITYMALKGLGIISPPQWVDRDVNIFAYIICFLLMLWLPLYAYYRWKLGG